MRRFGACLMMLLLLWPATASFAADEPSKEARALQAEQDWKVRRQKCARFTKQIVRQETVANMALDRGDSRWYDATRAQIVRLENQRIELCPEYKKPNPLKRFASTTARLAKKAGKAAARYFTGGAL